MANLISGICVAGAYLLGSRTARTDEELASDVAAALQPQERTTESLLDWRERLDLTWGEPIPAEGLGADTVILLPTAFAEVSRDVESQTVTLTYSAAATRMSKLTTDYSYANHRARLRVDTTCRGIWYTVQLSTDFRTWHNLTEGTRALADGQAIAWDIRTPQDMTTALFRVSAECHPFTADLPEGVTVS